MGWNVGQARLSVDGKTPNSECRGVGFSRKVFDQLIWPEKSVEQGKQ